MRKRIRVYPRSCTSACCGKIECPDDCRFLPALREFKAWCAHTKAVCTDPVWCPLVYEATNG